MYFKNYVFSYEFEGATWVFEIRAKDAAEAQRRVSRLSFARCDGELLVKVPLLPRSLVNVFEATKRILNSIRRHRPFSSRN